MSAPDAHFYLQQCQRLLREQQQEFENPEDLLSYINIARREVAGRTQCIRRLTPISGQCVSATLLTPGSGYVTPVATITPPDFPSGVKPSPNGRQATANVLSDRRGVVGDRYSGRRGRLLSAADHDLGFDRAGYRGDGVADLVADQHAQYRAGGLSVQRHLSWELAGC